MTFQYARRRDHLKNYPANPFKAEWVLIDGRYTSSDWNLFYWKDTPNDIFSIWEIGLNDVYKGGLYFKVKPVDGSDCPFQKLELQLGAICHLSTGERLTVDELISFKQLL